MDPLKEAFTKVKEDVASLRSLIIDLQNELQEIKRTLNNPTYESNNSTIQHITPTHNPTDLYKMPLEGLKTQYMPVSIGNRGVPTNKQTNQQTNQHIQNNGKFDSETAINSHANTHNAMNISQVLDTFSTLKEEVRLKFRNLTSQEMLVFSTIYQLEEEGHTVDYLSLSTKLKLTETSIRDYTHRMLKKGIPLIKSKENNKKVFLSIDPSLKKIANLSTIIQLREQ